MKIRSLQLKNIGVFEDETIHFPEKKSEGAEIHILTGQNGTGKTTILQALATSLFYKGPFPPFDIDLHNDAFLRIKKKYKDQEYSLYKITFDNNEIIDFSYKEQYEDRFVFEIHKFDNNKVANFMAFSYSGYRFIEHQENIDISKNIDYNPLKNALVFDKVKTSSDYTLNEWIAMNISKRALAREMNDEKSITRFDENIQNIQHIIKEITGQQIKFEPVYDTGIKIVANVEGKKLDFDLLPDGLRSIISWLGDLIMRMDAIKWENDLDIKDREFILFLDEIEVHLHPAWQRKILPVVQKLFKNAQIFITTHSPFIVNSVDGAFVYELKLDKQGNCHAEQPPHISSTSMPIDEVLEEIYNLTPTEMYGEKIRKEIEEFQMMLQNTYKRQNDFSKNELLEKAKSLALKSVDLRNNVQFELKQLSKNLGEEFAI